MIKLYWKYLRSLSINFLSLLLMSARNAKFGHIKPNHFCNGYYAFHGLTNHVEIIVNEPLIEDVSTCQIEIVKEEREQSEVCEKEVKNEVSECCNFEDMYVANENVLTIEEFKENQNVHEIVKSELNKKDVAKVPKMKAVVDAVLARIKLKKQSINGWST